ncbi:MAG: class A beta-lactamase-related serine hydrolase [Bacteroidetes bacterium]|nr:class A beta-lactamase-related serine hydrolase [Bacteroidota bacterium]MBU1484071.1 class A beta-lactamase-related serine hydrolase [Bacteroidota bacterium]MBU2268443.1 class A beta-lactamase-related serine hydrolase [Bacteroidota bacterium]MBU2376246.1 class A beta-lactamase-related serine hydrolase [Bacteroidota bacterium]
MKNLKLIIILTIMIQVSAKAQNPIEEILNNNPDLFKSVLEDPNHKEVQIIYTQINRDKHQKPHFITYSYQLDAQHYFYPASTVKLPTAIFALEKLNELKIKGLNKSSIMLTDSAFVGQTKVTKDSTAKNSLPSIVNYIKKILLVSDNDAFNRLYEFTDRKTINQKLKDYGFKNSRIINRLAIGDAGESVRHTNPINFYDGDQLVYQKPPAYDANDYPLELNHLIRGKAYLNTNDQLINEPFDFTGKNVFALADQQELMKRLFFPDAFPKSKRFNLTDDDYRLLYKYMSMYPTDSENPTYSRPDYFPAYCKFLFYGADPKAEINPNIKIFNKVGDSYGYTIDNSYFIDQKNGIEFFLAAVIQSNDNDIYNDNHYEYDTVCFPFLKNLGQKIYENELKRGKKYTPDLSKWFE